MDVARRQIQTKATDREGRGHVIGDYCCGLPGPLMIILAGVHGNEPAGVEAARRVMARLEEQRPALRGRVLALGGNLEGLRQRRRFIEQDLNRIWTPSLVAESRLERTRPAAERGEQWELVRAIDRAVEAADGRIVFLDLHSFSNPGPPFSIIHDTLPNRRYAFALGIPVVLGMDAVMEGTILDFCRRRGCSCVAVEAGQHDDPSTIDHHEAVLWVSLATIGLLRASAVTDLASQRRRLSEAAGDAPKLVQVDYHHRLQAGDRFRMRPGYRNFQEVRAGEPLAESRHGDVLAPRGGRILMPLYQEQGQDGYFLTAER